MGKWISTLLAAAAFIVGAQAAQANDAEKAQILVEEAKITIDRFAADPNMQWFQENVGSAKGLMIVPQSIKGGFVVGGSGGAGVLLARDAGSSNFSYPVFYNLGSVTFGLQIGGEVSEIILMIMTERGVDALLASSLKLGGDVSVAAGPVGAGAKAQTADVIAFVRSKGAFVGLNLEGAVIDVRDKFNGAYYAPGTAPKDIIVSRSVANAGADTLRATAAALVQ